MSVSLPFDGCENNGNSDISFVSSWIVFGEVDCDRAKPRDWESLFWNACLSDGRCVCDVVSSWNAFFSHGCKVTYVVALSTFATTITDQRLCWKPRCWKIGNGVTNNLLFEIKWGTTSLPESCCSCALLSQDLRVKYPHRGWKAARASYRITKT